MKTNRSLLNAMPRTSQLPPSSAKATDLSLSCHAPCLKVNVTTPQSKEAASIIEAVRKWGHYLYSRPFTLIADQRSLAFMFDQRNRGKIRNSKIQAWRAELGMFSYEVKHRSGKENVAADALSRVCSVAGHPSSLKGLHESLGHPGITRLWHFVRSKNLPFRLKKYVRRA